MPTLASGKVVTERKFVNRLHLIFSQIIWEQGRTTQLVSLIKVMHMLSYRKRFLLSSTNVWTVAYYTRQTQQGTNEDIQKWLKEVHLTILSLRCLSLHLFEFQFLRSSTKSVFYFAGIPLRLHIKLYLCKCYKFLYHTMQLLGYHSPVDTLLHPKAKVFRMT